MKNLLPIFFIVIAQVGLGQESVKMPVIDAIVKYGEPDLIYIYGVKDDVVSYQWKYGLDTVLLICEDSVVNQNFNYRESMPSSITSGAVVSDKYYHSKIFGQWLLDEKVCIVDGDTTIIKPSPNLIDGIYTAPHKPTEIKFNKDGTFNISQWCQKCPYINWQGTYILGSREDTYQIDIKFIEVRDKSLKKKQKSFTAEFGGVLKIIDNNSMSITDDMNCSWIYSRINEE